METLKQNIIENELWVKFKLSKSSINHTNLKKNIPEYNQNLPC